MSENTSEENNVFRDYKTENFDDNDLQSRLYAEIYYKPNVEDESKTSDSISRIQFTNTNNEINIESESMQQKSRDKQSLEFGAAIAKPSKTKKISREHYNQNIPFSNESSVTELIYNDISHAQNLTDDPAIEIRINTDKLSDQEMNPALYEHDNINNNSLKNSLVEKEKKCKENIADKHKSNYTENKHQENFLKDDTVSMNDTIYSKYNVLSKSKKQEMSLNKFLKKDKQSLDSSDSEESIFEIPVPPKPKPPLINLQDSDEENNTNSKMDKLIPKKINLSSYKIKDVSTSYQDTSFKNKSNDKSLYNKDTTVNPRNVRTRMQEIKEDIVLNCTIIQRGAKSINEIRQSSKHSELNKNQEDVSTQDKNQNSTKQILQNTSKENNANFQEEQEIFVIPENYSRSKMQKNIDKNNPHNKCNLKNKNNSIDAKVSCSNTAINRKRQYNSKIESSKEKRQCIVQQNNQHVTQQNSSNKETRSKSENEYFKPMSDTLRNYYYNSSRDQENFDVGELQRGMSKDPRLWKIIDEDLMPSPSSRQRTRFWNVRCTNCHRDGHQRYDCPIPRRMPCCYICGEKGHIESRCPQKICLTCGKQQNTFRKTCEYCRVLYCTMCHSIGHESTHCPDLWRRYHQTTDMNSALQNPGDVMKPPGLLHCCNCTKRGHDSSMCKEYRWSQHFQTPAAVTNYMDGPVYTYATNFSDSNFKMDILSSEATSSTSSIPHSYKNIQQTTEKYSKFSQNRVDILSSNAKVNETIPQKTLCTSEIEENLESPLVKYNIKLQPEKNQKKHKINQRNEEEFTNIIFSCGKFRNKENKNARIITRNLSLLKNNLSSYGKETIINLPKCEIAPVFLNKLFSKAIEFEVKIGFTIHQHKAIILQLIAMKEYIELIYDLLLYWINLPEDEKNYGIEIDLPMNCNKMLNVLRSRTSQVRKMRPVTCYKNVEKMKHPQWLFKYIEHQKILLEQHNDDISKYLRLRKRLWRLQLKLLNIINIEPEQNVYVSEFWKTLRQLEYKKQNQIKSLDFVSYLKFILVYNHLFVPHTPITLSKILRRIEKQEIIAKNKNCSKSPQILQELEKNGMCEEKNLESSVTSCTSQNINYTENPSAINIQQSTHNKTLIEGRNMVNISPTNDIILINDTIDCDNNEVTIIKDSIVQDSQTIMSSNIKTFNCDELIVPIEDRKDQLTSIKVSIKCNTSANKQDINTKYIVRNSTEKEKWNKQLKKNENKKERKIRNMYKNASKLIRKAYAFKLPHMINAAKELQRKINKLTITEKHVDTMRRMIQLEEIYQKNVNSIWKELKK